VSDPLSRAESDLYLLAEVLESRREREELVLRYARACGSPPSEEVTSAKEQAVAVRIATALDISYSDALGLCRWAPLKFSRSGQVVGLDLSLRQQSPDFPERYDAANFSTARPERPGHVMARQRDPDPLKDGQGTNSRDALPPPGLGYVLHVRTPREPYEAQSWAWGAGPGTGRAMMDALQEAADRSGRPVEGIIKPNGVMPKKSERGRIVHPRGREVRTFRAEDM
jgi:hypothetical protein